MSREIFCHVCNISVGTLQNGSLIRKGTIYTCYTCSKPTTATPVSDTPFTDRFMSEYSNDLFDVGNMFDNLFKKSK